MRRHGEIADAIEESLIEEDDDPNYQPPGEQSDNTKDSDCEDRQLVDIKSRPSVASKKRAGRKLLEVEQLASGTTSRPCTPPRNKPRLCLVDVEPVEEDTQKATAPKTGKQQHHAKRNCPICGKVDANLKCRLKSHAKKGLIDEDQVEKMLSIVTHKGKRRKPCWVTRQERKKD